MPVETWFPTAVFFEDLAIPDGVHDLAMQAIRSAIDPDRLQGPMRYTAMNAPNSLHLDPRLGPLLDCLDPAIRRFLFETLRFDAGTTQFYVGRCWPVVQTTGGEGGLHVHGGAVVSGVFYLEAPPGSGALEFRKTHGSTFDHVAKRELCELTYQSTTYPAVRHRLMLFGADVRHRGLPNEPGTPDARVAIAFDLYSMADLEVPYGGMPHARYLRPIG